jgi:hypothetical protein
MERQPEERIAFPYSRYMAPGALAAPMIDRGEEEIHRAGLHNPHGPGILHREKPRSDLPWRRFVSGFKNGGC